jgi:CheY-like chemotaxis protein
LRALKAAPETRQVPVIVLSAVPDRLDPALRDLASAVLGKPTDAQALFDAVRDAVGERAPRGRTTADRTHESAEPGC